MIVEKYPIPETDMTEIAARARKLGWFTCGDLIDTIKAYATEIRNPALGRISMRLADRLIQKFSKAGKIQKSGAGIRARWSWVGA